MTFGFRALAQVSCSLVVPKEGRPHEGFVHVSLDMSPMASPSYEAGRQEKSAKSQLYTTKNLEFIGWGIMASKLFG